MPWKNPSSPNDTSQNSSLKSANEQVLQEIWLRYNIPTFSLSERRENWDDYESLKSLNILSHFFYTHNFYNKYFIRLATEVEWMGGWERRGHSKKPTALKLEPVDSASIHPLIPLVFVRGSRYSKSATHRSTPAPQLMSRPCGVHILSMCLFTVPFYKASLQFSHQSNFYIETNMFIPCLSPRMKRAEENSEQWFIPVPIDSIYIHSTRKLITLQYFYPKPSTNDTLLIYIFF